MRGAGGGRGEETAGEKGTAYPPHRRNNLSASVSRARRAFLHDLFAHSTYQRPGRKEQEVVVATRGGEGGHNTRQGGGETGRARAECTGHLTRATGSRRGQDQARGA